MIPPDHYRAARESAGFLRRTDKGWLRLTGTDRLSYLQGLLTNDVARLESGTGVYAALLTAQGRMIADMNVLEGSDGAVLLELERAVTPSVGEHLERFVITEDVIVDDISDAVAHVGLYGPGAAALLSRVLDDPDAIAAVGSLPPLSSRLTTLNQSPVRVVTTDAFGVPGFEVLCEAGLSEAVEQQVRGAGGVAIGIDTLEVLRIEHGTPKFLQDMDTTTIPLEAGIEDRAISMSKGCYVGQEVIVRVLHRGGGRVAKKLVKLRSDAPLSRDDRLWSGDREAGRITSAAESPRLGFIALGYVHRDFTDPGTPLTTTAGAVMVVDGGW